MVVVARRSSCSGVGRPLGTGPAKLLAPSDGVDAHSSPSLEIEIVVGGDVRLRTGNELRPRLPDILALGGANQIVW